MSKANKETKPTKNAKFENIIPIMSKFKEKLNKFKGIENPLNIFNVSVEVKKKLEVFKVTEYKYSKIIFNTKNRDNSSKSKNFIKLKLE